MGYRGLGVRTVTAKLNSDPVNNPGNWTAVLAPADIAINHNYFELYHLALRNGPPGSTMTWFVDNTFYEITSHGDLDSWNPNQALELNPGQTLKFFWNKGTGSAPIVSAFFRYDTLT